MSSVPSNCSLKQPLLHYRVMGDRKWREVSLKQVRSLIHGQKKGHTFQQQTKTLLCLILVIVFFKEINKWAGRAVRGDISARRKHWVLQNAVEGTHRDLVQAVLTLNHWTTLLTGSAAYSLQDTLHQYTSHCSNHGRPPEIDKMFTLPIMCHGTLWSCHNIMRQWPSHEWSKLASYWSPKPQLLFVKQTLRNLN